MNRGTFYYDDPVETPVATPKRRAPYLIFLLLISAFFLRGTFAANIGLNNSGTLEFGQGVQVLAACSGSTPLTIKPVISFSNVSGAGSYKLTGITVSNIPSSCFGEKFQINAYSETATAPLSLYNSTSTNVVVINDSGTYYTDGAADLGITTNSTTSFTATFRTPVAEATSAYKFTVQSDIATGTYWITANQQLYFDASNTSSYSRSGNTFVNLGLAGSSKNGTISSATFSTTNSPGHFSFGQSKGISYPRTITGDDFTIAVWFRMNACDGGSRPSAGTMAFDSAGGQLVSASVGGSADDWDFASISCYLGFQTGSSGGGEETIWANSPFTPNVWHYAVATRAKATGKTDLFIDGVLVGGRASSSLTNGRTLSGNATQGIGYDTDWGINQRYLLGDIAVVQQYNSVLTLSEIQTNYNALRSRYGN
jgi:hypothetical protein